MNANDLITAIINADPLDIGAALRAIHIFEEEALDKFINLQYTEGSPGRIEVNVSDEMQNRLFERTQSQWAKVGASEPYASVLSNEKFSMKNIAENLIEFRQSGISGIDQLISLAKKNDVSINFNRCFELGCGVGRMTSYFADHFLEVVAADISPGNISVCQEYFKEIGKLNVDLKLLTKLMDLEQIGYFDAFLSFIAIQHNSPPIQRYILEKTLSKLNYGGVFLFQTIVHHPTYSYTAKSNFNYPSNQDFEMHVLPMREVLHVISRCGLTLLDVIKDRQGGYGIDSNSFFGINLKKTCV